MSNEKKDTNQQNSSTGLPTKKGTERDLWDLEFDEPSSTPEQNKAVEEDSAPEKLAPVIIPTRRTKESPIQSRKPSERVIVAPEIAPDEAAPEKESFTDPAKKTAEKKNSSKDAEITETPPKETTAPSKKSFSEEETVAKETEILEKTETHSPSSPGMLASLTKTEKIGLSALIAILALGATFSILHFSNRVPTRSIYAQDLDLPIEGRSVKVTAASTFWRQPITGGDSPDVVKRGTKLIPVLKLTVESKSAAIRVLFRNEDGLVIGDPINRSVSGKTQLNIPATGGFEDIGMHAAYRTGESPPWIAQVLEASDSGASIDKFKLLLETEISTDIR
jgi:hypothetical protein